MSGWNESMHDLTDGRAVECNQSESSNTSKTEITTSAALHTIKLNSLSSCCPMMENIQERKRIIIFVNMSRGQPFVKEQLLHHN